MDVILTRYPALNVEIYVRERLARHLEWDQLDLGLQQDKGKITLSDESDDDKNEDDSIDETDDENEDDEDGDDNDGEWHNIEPHQKENFIAIMRQYGSVICRRWPAMKAFRGLAIDERYTWPLFQITVKWFSRGKGAGAEPEELRGELYEDQGRAGPGTMEIDMRGLLRDTDENTETMLCQDRLPCNGQPGDRL